MKRLSFLAALLLVLAACGGAHNQVSAIPGHGAVALTVTPNPIIAQPVSGDTYRFPFDVSVRETGGQPINITRVTATVFAPGGIALGDESWDADRIRSMGYNPSIAANGETKLHFEPVKSVTDERVFGALSAELKVEAVDASGTPTSATTVVTVRHQ